MSAVDQSPKAALLYALACSILFAGMSSCIKELAEYPLSQIVFFRCGVSLCVVVLIQAARGKLFQLRTNRFWEHMIRSTFGLLSMALHFASYHMLPLAEATAISRSTPIFLGVCSVFLLSEKVRFARWFSIGLGFAGVIIMVAPFASGTGVIHSGTLVALGAAIFAALAMVMVRRLGFSESSNTIVFYFMMSGTIISSAFMLFSWKTPHPFDLLLFVGAGVFGALGQIFLMLAYRHGEASLVAPVDYLGVVWAALLGYLIWLEIPNLESFIGALIILVSQVYLFRHERRATVASVAV